MHGVFSSKGNGAGMQVIHGAFSYNYHSKEESP